MGIGVLSQELMLPRREADYSPPFSADIKNGEVVTALPIPSH
jgi:hypothetical protein